MNFKSQKRFLLMKEIWVCLEFECEIWDGLGFEVEEKTVKNTISFGCLYIKGYYGH